MNLLFTYKIFITTGWFLVVFIAERLFMAAHFPPKLKNVIPVQPEIYTYWFIGMPDQVWHDERT